MVGGDLGACGELRNPARHASHDRHRGGDLHRPSLNSNLISVTLYRSLWASYFRVNRGVAVESTSPQDAGRPVLYQRNYLGRAFTGKLGAPMSTASSKRGTSSALAASRLATEPPRPLLSLASREAFIRSGLPLLHGYSPCYRRGSGSVHRSVEQKTPPVGRHGNVADIGGLGPRNHLSRPSNPPEGCVER